MAGIEAMIRMWQKVKMTKVLEKSLNAKKQVLEELQIGQMQYGISPTGDKIGKYKSKYYAKYKFQLSNLAGYGYIDLRLSGDFHKRLFATITKSSVIFFSKVSYTKDLVSRYDPFGLAPQTRTVFDKKFSPLDHTNLPFINSIPYEPA